MKFLDPRFEGRNLMPLHVMSYDSFELGARDAIAILFKDMTTGQKYVQTIEHPKYEVWVLKREYWARALQMAAGDCVLEPWEEKANCECFRISYHNREKEMARILGCEPADVKYSPLIFGYDIDVEHFYWMHFLIEYGNDIPKKVSVGLFDIESDIIQITGKAAAPGSCPTSAITFIDVDHLEVYTFVNTKDGLPVYAETHPNYAQIQKVRDNFYEQVDHFQANLDKFIDELHSDFDDSYGVFKYHILCFDDEIRMHQAFWQIARASNIDILEAWNLPYDARNLIERPLVLGFEPESIICDSDYKYKMAYFEEDDNIQAHKRNHKCVISVKFLMLCQMWMYAGLRVAEGRQSLKLTSVGKKEVKDEKLDYSEDGSIRTIRYRNFCKFIKYNIKDVLLQYGILRATDDALEIYDRCYDACIPLPQAFVSTNLVTYAMMKYFYEQGYVCGTNGNKFLPTFDYRQFFAADDATDNMRSVEEMLMDAESFDPDDIFVSDEDMEDSGYGDD